jgi:hypothetical protein
MTMLLTERWSQKMAPPHAQATARAGHGAAGVPDGAAGLRVCGDEETAQELLGEMAALIRDTRPSLMVSGAVGAAVLIGLAVESMALPVTGRGPGAVAATGLFVVVALCLLRTLTLIVLAGLPLGQVLSQQRVTSGAPLDPRAPWASIPGPGTARPWGWDRAHLLLSQARFRADRIQSATNWSLITTAVFLACTAVVLLAR